MWLQPEPCRGDRARGDGCSIIGVSRVRVGEHGKEQCIPCLLRNLLAVVALDIHKMACLIKASVEYLLH